MNRRLLALMPLVLMAGCAGPVPADYAAERPTFDLRRYFDGPVQAHGMVTDRSGRVLRRFRVEMVGRWNGAQGELDEHFTYSDGRTERRVWRLTDEGGGRWSGRADDVVGVAQGVSAGPTLNWRYTLRLPVDGSIYEVQFDDWMIQIDDRVVLNKAEMRKFGIRVGEVTLAFLKP